MSNIELLFTFFSYGFVWFAIIFISWLLYLGIKAYTLKKYYSKYQCPANGCLGCNYLDLCLSKVDGVTWHCVLGREAKNPFRH